MPPARDDKRLLIVVGVFVALAGALFAGVILLATSREVGEKKPLFLGQRPDLVQSIREASPLYFASPFADDGFWLDLEDGTLVAYVLERPDPGECTVKWREQRGAYIGECDDEPVDAADLERYPVTIGARGGSPSNSVYVDLRRTIPAPGSGGTAG